MSLYQFGLSINNSLTINGINILVFSKITRTIKSGIDKDETLDDFIPICQNSEEDYNIYDSKRDNIIIIKENKNYYPIVLIEKNNRFK